MIYVASPIDHTTDNGVRQAITLARLRIERELEHTQLTAYWPNRAFTVTPGAVIEATIGTINRVALAESWGVVALLPGAAPTWGVPAEIEQALAAGKMVAIVTDRGDSGQAQNWKARGAHLSLDEKDAIGWLARWGVVALLPGVKTAGPEPEYLKVQLGENGRTPTRAYPGDAGYDLYTAVETKIGPGEFADVDCDIRIQLPQGVWGFIVGRSSTVRDRGLIVQPAIIDQGWRGGIFAGVYNPSGGWQTIEQGARIAQLIPIDLVADRLEPVAVTGLDPSERGIRGFGSSGR